MTLGSGAIVPGVLRRQQHHASSTPRRGRCSTGRRPTPPWTAARTCCGRRPATAPRPTPVTANQSVAVGHQHAVGPGDRQPGPDLLRRLRRSRRAPDRDRRRGDHGRRHRHVGQHRRRWAGDARPAQRPERGWPSTRPATSTSPTPATTRSARSPSRTGVITTVAGTGTAGNTGDGGQATSARLRNPYDVAFGPDGSMYIADRGNHKVRKVSTSAGVITTVAGNGSAGYNGDEIAATSARLNNPYGVDVDNDGQPLHRRLRQRAGAAGRHQRDHPHLRRAPVWPPSTATAGRPPRPACTSRSTSR